MLGSALAHFGNNNVLLPYLLIIFAKEMERINKTKIIRNFFSLSLVQGITALLQLVVVPYVINKVGLANFGIIAVAQVVMHSLTTITECGYAQYGTKLVALNKNSKVQLSEVFFHSIYTRIILTLACFLLLLLLSTIPFIQQSYFLYLWAFIFVPGQALLPFWFFQGMEKMHWITFFTLCSKIIFVVLVFLFIKNPNDAGLYIFFMGLGNILVALAASLFIIKKYKLSTKGFFFKKAKHIIVANKPLTASNLMMNLMQYGGLFILRLFTNDIVAGYFSVAERIYFAMKQIVAAFGQAIYPNICRFALQGNESLKKYLSKIFNPFWFLTVLASIIVFLLAPWIIQFFLTTHHSESVFILRMLCIALPIVCANIPGSLTMLAFNQTKKYFLVYLIGFMIFIISNLVLASLFQASGTIAAIYTTETFITVSFTLLLHFTLKNKVSENQ